MFPRKEKVGNVPTYHMVEMQHKSNIPKVIALLRCVVSCPDLPRDLDGKIDGKIGICEFAS